MAKRAEGMTSSCPSLQTNLFVGAFLWAPFLQEPEVEILWVAEAGLEDVGLGLKEDAEIFLEEACLWLNLPRPTQCRIHLVARREDLAKALGGGLPIGVVSGAPEVLSYITTDHGGGKPRFYNGGTFSANPLTVAAGMAVVRYLSETREETYARLERAGETVRAELNDYCLSNGVPAHVIGIGSMFQISL